MATEQPEPVQAPVSGDIDAMEIEGDSREQETQITKETESQSAPTKTKPQETIRVEDLGLPNEPFYLRYYAGHQGRFGHEFLGKNFYHCGFNQVMLYY
ncbi:mago nashi protein [Sugiyamaella lignohabitans]|uniref:Mago nashi protein n=1 Tax=Sugiyamaella lignohabitans TaxID=796027 RepID=A0A161HJM8_9ASCO|nr:mago nashi protein [Sugiyamaella lignohabitans]ANB11648.1 mago nashi protein [Sugiyamaella lignohabitans]